MLGTVARYAGAILILGLGLARGAGGVLLLARGAAAAGLSASPAASRLMGLGLVAVGGLCLVAGVALLLSRRWAVRLALAALTAFIADGLANGAVLFGAPRPAGVAVNLAVAALIASLVVPGRSTPPEPPGGNGIMA